MLWHIPLGLVGLAVYLLIGTAIGAVSWDHYKENTRQWQGSSFFQYVERKTWAMWLFFPLPTYSDKFEEDVPWRWIGVFEERENYLKFLALFWPIKLLMCLVGLVAISVWGLTKLAIWPFNSFLNLSIRLFKGTHPDEERRESIWLWFRKRVATKLVEGKRVKAEKSRRLRVANTPGNRLAALKRELADLEVRKTGVIAEIQRLEGDQAAEEGSFVYRADRSSDSRWRANSN